MHNDIVVQVSSEFTGRLVLYIENGQLVSHQPLLKGYHITTLEGFFEMAEAAGYKVLEAQRDA